MWKLWSKYWTWWYSCSIKNKRANFFRKNSWKKINDSIIIREQDFLVEPEEFKFKRSNLINIQTIYLTNNTNITWRKKTCFICVREKSSLIGNDVIFDDEVAPGNYTTAEIVYDNMENVNKKEYYSTYKLINENKEQIGKLHTFKILMS